MAHLHTAYRCNFCCEIPETAPIFQCPNRHQYCHECFRKLQRLYRGNSDGGGCCLICKYNGRFIRNNVDSDFLKKLKTRPGIGRPCRYNKKSIVFDEKLNYVTGEETVNQGDGFMATRLVRSLATMSISKRPLICLHNNCSRSVAVSSLLSHFKYEHPEVPFFGTNKGKELKLLFDVSLIEHDKTHCLAMITLYECNKIDVVRSRSSQSVINTCSRLSGRVPINTFWLMMGGSAKLNKFSSYALFWLYSNSEEHYWSTLELSSRNDKMSLSNFSSTVGLHHQCRSFEDVARSMNCLYVTYGSFLALLGEGEKINLRITLH